MFRLLSSLLLISAAWGQFGEPAADVKKGANLPATCQPGNIFHRTGVTNPGLYDCPAANNWRLVAIGGNFTARGVYAGGTTYAALDLVSYSGVAYVSVAGSNTGHTPDASPTWWAIPGYQGAAGSNGTNGADGAAGTAGAAGATGAAGAGNNANCIDATGSTTTYTCPTPTPTVTSLNGLLITFVPQTTNTASFTINVAGLGAKTAKKANGSTNFSSGDAVGGTAYLFAYDGTNFRQASSGTAGTVTTSGTPTNSAIAAFSDTAVITTPCSGCLLDTTGLTLPGILTTGAASGLAGADVYSQGTLPLFGSSAGQIPTTGYNGWVGALSGITASYGVQLPVAVPAANQMFLFPAPTASLSQGTWIDTTGTGNVIRSSTLDPLKVCPCEIIIGDPGAASAALANDNDSPSICANLTGVTMTITEVKCLANSSTGGPTVLPIITGGASTSILSGGTPLACGNGVFGSAGTLNGTPTQVDGATIDGNISTAGGTAKLIIIRIKRTLP